jgi:hypothetical protein
MEVKMRFIEMTGRQLGQVVNDGELRVRDLAAAGVHPETVVRVNEQGDIEVRRRDAWDVIGGLLGEYDERIKDVTGLDWA